MPETRRRPPLARALAAALFLALVAASSPAADDPVAARAQVVIDALRAGDPAAAVAKLDEGPDADAIAQRTDLVHVLCDRAFRFDAERPDPLPRRALAARLLELAAAAAQFAQPGDDRVRWAQAEALVLRERAGPRAGAPAWTQAADLLEQVEAIKPGDSLPLAYAVAFLLEGACCEPDSAVPFAKRADEIARRALTVQKDSPTLAVTIGSSQLWAARTLVAVNRKVAKDEIRAAFASLERFTSGATPVLEAATVWNDAVALARRSGLVFDERFVVAQHPVLDGSLTVDVPVSSRWTFESVPATETAPGYAYVTETTDDGKRLRQVIFRRYAFGLRYTFEKPVPVGGDNVRGIAQGLAAMTVARVFSPGAKLGAPARKPFNKAMDGYVFDVEGRAASEPPTPGEPLRVNAYVMKGREQACYAAIVYGYGTDDETTPEVEALIASLREPER